MAERQRQDAPIRFRLRDPPHGDGDLGVGDLRPRPELGEPLAFAGAGERQRGGPGLIADIAADRDGAAGGSQP